MEYLQNSPLPAVCQVCAEPDCWECDCAEMRWELPERDRLVCSRKLKEKAIAHYQRQIAELDRRLAELEKLDCGWVDKHEE